MNIFNEFSGCKGDAYRCSGALKSHDDKVFHTITMLYAYEGIRFGGFRVGAWWLNITSFFFSKQLTLFDIIRLSRAGCPFLGKPAFEKGSKPPTTTTTSASGGVMLDL